MKEKNKKKIIILVLGIIGFILFALSWIPFIEFEIDKQNYEFMKGRNNHNWVYPFFVIFTILFFCFTLLCFFKTKSKNKPNSKTKINELRKKLEKAKQYEEKNKAALNSFKGINQLKVCINVIDQFGPFIDEMRKDGRTITILDKDKIVNELKNLYIVPVWFVTFIRILCSSNITLSKEEAVVIIDAMYDTRVKLHKEDEELKKFVDEKRKTLPEDIYKLQDYINSLNENEDRDFEEIYIACRIFFEKNYTFSGE